MHARLALASLWAVIPSTVLARTYYGCYTEGTASRALDVSSYADLGAMTLESCERHCTEKNLPIWGVEYGSECYCGRTLAVGAISTFSSQCATPCSGNAGQTCGGNAHLSLYGSSSQKPREQPVPHPEATSIEYLGCFAEGNGVRALGGGAVADGREMTVFACGRYCLNRGFLLFGLEYTSECYCADPAVARLLTRALESDCNMPCSGNTDQVCGGSNRLGVFQWFDEAARRGGSTGRPPVIITPGPVTPGPVTPGPVRPGNPMTPGPIIVVPTPA